MTDEVEFRCRSAANLPCHACGELTLNLWSRHRDPFSTAVFRACTRQCVDLLIIKAAITAEEAAWGKT